MLPLQVPLQDMNANIDLQLHLQKQQVYEQIALGHITDEELYLRKWSSRPLLPSGVQVELKNRELWQKFHAKTTEMIITKLGRRMFPSIQTAVYGLNKHSNYYVCMELILSSNRRHKYCGNSEENDGDKKNENKNNVRGWSFAGPAEPQSPLTRRIYVHPDSPATGEYWMQNSISFSKLKLTNNVGDQRNNIILTSMHKYIPKIWLIRCSNAITVEDLFTYPASEFTFKETEFIAVTAYQNAKITKLKIYNNPFAKGFRETGQSRCKRKYQISQADEEESSSDSSDLNPGANNLDDLAKNSAKRSKTGNSDNYDESSITIDKDQKSPSTLESTHHESETSSPFYRPWLDSHKRSSKPMIPMIPMVSSAPSFLSKDLNCSQNNFDHYLQSLAFEQQNLLRYYQYYYPISIKTRLSF